MRCPLKPEPLDIYRGRDPVLIPCYGIAEAAHWLGLPAATVRNWLLGWHYKTGAGPQFSERLIELADQESRLLSFQNLIEVYVLGAIRRKYEVQMPAIRRALQFLCDEFGSTHPLSEEQMHTDGTSLLVERYGQLINVSQRGQLEMRELLERSLKRIDRDPTGVPRRLFPFTSRRLEEERRPVSIDPRVQFGRPCLAGKGIPTDAIIDRFRAGDTIADIAEDYGQATIDIEEAIRYEEQGAAA
ncbi:MAG: DUF433 domain-containing protein [Planctomycetota bacterium]